MTIEPIFYDMFGLWLHADAIDLNDYPELLRKAKKFGGIVYHDLKDPAAVIQSSKEYLENPVEEVTQALMDKSDMDWMAGEREQQALRDVVTAIIQRMEETDQALRTPSTQS